MKHHSRAMATFSEEQHGVLEVEAVSECDGLKC